MTNKTERFIKVYSQAPEEGGSKGTEIWLDKETGVNYLFRYVGYAECFTPLLDENGKPIVTLFEEGEKPNPRWDRNRKKVG